MEPQIEMDAQVQALEDKTLMVLDDDAPFRGRLARALTQRGFTVSAVATVEEAKQVSKLNPPAFAVLDLRLEDGSGLEVVEELHKFRDDARYHARRG